MSSDLNARLDRIESKLDRVVKLLEGTAGAAKSAPAKKDLTKVFQQFANTATEGAKACLDKKKIKRALKVMLVYIWISCCFHKSPTRFCFLIEILLQ